MWSSRLAATSCSRFRSPSTISLDESLVRSSAVAKVSTSRFPNMFSQDEEELETAEEEVEAPGPVLPHRRCRPVVVADEHNRVDRLEPPLEQPEEPETHRRVDTSAVLIGDDPAEDAAGAQDPMGFGRDLFHLLIEASVAARDPTETSGVEAVYDVVGVR